MQDDNVLLTKDQKQSISGKIFEDLKSGILELRFPPGSFISDRMIAQQEGVSRTPVREALKRLSQEGWISWEERKRAKVKELTLQDVKEVFFLRKMIEPAAVKEVFAHQEPRHLAGELSLIVNRMKKAIDAPVVFMQEDMAFHSTIIHFVNNVRLMDIWSEIANESMRIAIYALYEKRRPRDVVQEHEAIVEALWSRDLSLSLNELGKHHKSIFIAYEEKFLMDLKG